MDRAVARVLPCANIVRILLVQPGTGQDDLSGLDCARPSLAPLLQTVHDVAHGSHVPRHGSKSSSPQRSSSPLAESKFGQYPGIAIGHWLYVIRSESVCRFGRCHLLCGLCSYIAFSGDSVGSTTEYFTIDLGLAFSDSAWTGSTIVNLLAGWFGGTDYGEATISMYTYRLVPGGFVEDRNDISFVIDPNFYGDLNCPPLVATATVTIGVGGRVTITVTK
jgi:hypothetical protein